MFRGSRIDTCTPSSSPSVHFIVFKTSIILHLRLFDEYELYDLINRDVCSQNAGYAGNRATLFAQQPQKSQQAQSPQLSQVRGLTSPSPRQSPFPADISPTTATSYVSAAAASQQQYRLQRTMSMPGNANIPTSQVPSGIISSSRS